MNGKLLVTGATGFVGREIVKIYPHCRCVIRMGESLLHDDVFAISGIDKDTQWLDALKSVDTIIHLAGVAHNKFTNEDYISINTEGTLHLAREAVKAGVKRFVFVSSIGVNGTSTDTIPFSFDSTPNPHNPYSWSKYNAELGLNEIANYSGIEVVIVRPTLVYGKDAPGNFGMLTNLIRKSPILPFGLANNRRDFISVHNLADLLVVCATHPKAAGNIFLPSDGVSVSIKKFTSTIAEGLGKERFQLPIPVSFMRLVGKLTGKSAMIEQLFGNLQVDSSNIKDVLDWNPPYTMQQAMAKLRD